jgi:UDP-2,3-diacylglucosamine pyrophosphatase LpxH
VLNSVQVRSIIQQDDLTLPETFARFPTIPQWDLRRLYADVKREEAMRAREAQTDALVSLPPGMTRKGIEAMHAGWLRPMLLSFAPLPFTEPLFTRAGKTTAIISDIHAPDQDDHAMDVMYQICRAVGIDRLIIDGDLFDVASVSKYAPSAERHLRWVDERREAMRTVVQIRQNFPDIPIDFIPGNHDVRPLKWVDSNATALQGLFTLEQWLGLDDPALNFNVVKDGRVMLANGQVMVKHGTSVSGNAGYSVMKEIAKAGTSVIMGHVHRRAIIEVTKAHADLVGVELGCLCSLTPHYGNKEDVVNWQQGFALFTEYDDGDFEIELVKIKDGRAKFRGMRFESRLSEEVAA